MKTRHGGNRVGFTLAETVLALAAVLIFAVLAVYFFKRSPRHEAADGRLAQARQILDELRTLDSAVDQYAIENCKCSGTPVEWNDIQRYLRPESRLYGSSGLDPLDSAYRASDGGGTFKVDEPPALAPDTFKAFSDIVPKDFWSPYLKP